MNKVLRKSPLSNYAFELESLMNEAEAAFVAGVRIAGKRVLLVSSKIAGAMLDTRLQSTPIRVNGVSKTEAQSVLTRVFSARERGDSEIELTGTQIVIESGEPCGSCFLELQEVATGVDVTVVSTGIYVYDDNASVEEQLYLFRLLGEDAGINVAVIADEVAYRLAEVRIEALA